MVDKENTQLTPPPTQKVPAPQARKGVLSWFFGLFSRRSDDFERKLQHLSKEERAVHTRLKKRTRTWAKVARVLILYSILFEIVLLGFAVWTTRSPALHWKQRAIRIFPSFAVPIVVSLVYFLLASYYRMREKKDLSSLERLKAERQAKIDELKEKTNYYALQQLIQQYDSDPAAKAAAATVLASKIGGEAGLKLAFESPEEQNQGENSMSPSLGTEHVTPSGLRRRKGSKFDHADAASLKAVDDSYASRHVASRNYEEGFGDDVLNDGEMQRIRERGSTGGWIARLAAMLVGEDPAQCYALICKNCYMHNGLAKKEDFQYITYYCPHCNCLNGHRPAKEDPPEAIGSLYGPSDPEPEVSARPAHSPSVSVHSGIAEAEDKNTGRSMHSQIASVVAGSDESLD